MAETLYYKTLKTLKKYSSEDLRAKIENGKLFGLSLKIAQQILHEREIRAKGEKEISTPPPAQKHKPEQKKLESKNMSSDIPIHATPRKEDGKRVTITEELLKEKIEHARAYNIATLPKIRKYCDVSLFASQKIYKALKN